MKRIIIEKSHLLNSSRFRVPFSGWMYDIMSDAVVYYDEMGYVKDYDLVNLKRYLFNYRSSLICAEEGNKYGEIWQMAKQHCPKWKGFYKKRCAYNPKIKNRLERIRKVSKWKMDKVLKDEGEE